LPMRKGKTIDSGARRARKGDVQNGAKNVENSG
jgi:hypothetical protein